MASLSDIIENFIIKMFKEMEEEVLEIQRNELANKFQCAPSQINYVLSTRFSLERGYYVESKRGGGGYVRITRLNIDDEEKLIKHILENIGDSISQQNAMDYIKRLHEKGIISLKEALIIRAAIDRKSLSTSNGPILRANILKRVISSILYYGSL